MAAHLLDHAQDLLHQGLGRLELLPHAPGPLRAGVVLEPAQRMVASRPTEGVRPASPANPCLDTLGIIACTSHMTP